MLIVTLPTILLIDHSSMSVHSYKAQDPLEFLERLWGMMRYQWHLVADP